MYCKKCGRPHHVDAKFCMHCGQAVSSNKEKSTQAPPLPKEARLSKEGGAKDNVFQKLLFLMALVWLVTGLFFIPYKERGVIVYDTLWSKHESMAWQRVLLWVSLLALVVLGVHKYLSRFNSSTISNYKRVARREFFLFLIFLAAPFICGLYLFGTNYTNRNKEKSIIEELGAIDGKIAQNNFKKETRKGFWNECKMIFDLSMFDNKVHRFWDDVSNKIDSPNVAEKLYGYFNVDDSWAGKYNKLQRRFGIDSPDELRAFIHRNVITEEDFKNDKETEALIKKGNGLLAERDRLIFYNNNDMRRISLLVVAIVFGLFYCVRPLLGFIKATFNEIK